MVKRLAGYGRTSTEEQKRNGNGMEIQEAAIRAHITVLSLTEDEPVELVDMICEDAESGSSAKDRTKLMALLERVKRKEIDGIVVTKIDRFARNVKELLNIHDDILEPNGCKLISIKEKFDTSTALGRLFFQLIGSFAEYERSVIAERVIEGITLRARQGKHASGNVPTGYRSVEINGKKELHPDSDSDGLRVVKTVFRLRDQAGMTYMQIATYLNEQTDFKPKNWKPDKPTKFHDSSVRTIYNNPKYKGIYTFNRRGEQTIVVKNEGLKVYV